MADMTGNEQTDRYIKKKKSKTEMTVSVPGNKIKTLFND